MLSRVLHWLAAVLDGDTSADETSESEDRFVPSRLDASVRAAHGGSGDTIQREIEHVQEQARQLDDR
jgi:hypothetical protein